MAVHAISTPSVLVISISETEFIPINPIDKVVFRFGTVFAFTFVRLFKRLTIPVGSGQVRGSKGRSNRVAIIGKTQMFQCVKKIRTSQRTIAPVCGAGLAQCFFDILDEGYLSWK